MEHPEAPLRTILATARAYDTPPDLLQSSLDDVDAALRPKAPAHPLLKAFDCSDNAKGLLRHVIAVCESRQAEAEICKEINTFVTAREEIKDKHARGARMA